MRHRISKHLRIPSMAAAIVAIVAGASALMPAVRGQSREGGGQVVATGTPEQVAQHAGSHTGRYLASYLQAPSR